MTSKFFATGDSDSDSEEQFSDDDLVTVDEKSTAAGNRFVYESSESEEEKRVVRSKKDTKYESMLHVIKALKNHIKINDWTSIAKDFENLNKQLAKAKTVVEKEGIPTFYFRTLKQLDDAIRVTFANKEGRKKMSQTNSKALNSMKQNLKKTITQYQTQYDAYLKNPGDEQDEEEEEEEAPKKAKPAPAAAAAPKPAATPAKKPSKKDSDDEDEEEDDDDDDDEDDESDDDKKLKAVGKKVTKPGKKKQESDDESEESEESEEEDDDDEEDEDEDDEEEASDDDESASDDDKKESSSDEDDEDVDLNIEAATGGIQFTRAFWVKKDTSAKPAKKDREERKVQKPSKKDKPQEEKPEEQKTEKKEEYTPEAIIRKLKELLAMRGKRGTDRLAMLNELKLLAEKSTEPATLLKIKTTLASALFDMTLLAKADYMPVKYWREAYNVCVDMIELLKQHPNVRLSEDESVEENFDEDDEEEEEKKEGEDGVEEPVDEHKAFLRKKKEKEEAARRAKAGAAGIDDDDTTGTTVTVDGQSYQYVNGNLFSFILGLFAEYRKSMQNIDHHKPEYVSRLKDESALIKICERAREYYASISKLGFESKITLLHLELVYYQYHQSLDRLNQVVEMKQKQQAEETKSSEPVKQVGLNILAADDGLVASLASFLYKHGDDQTRLRALLLHIYHYALHNRYTEARDMLLMSHVQDNISSTDIRTQILFNRAMAQLGLCAFRVGEHRQALFCLAELYQSNRIKELIAQGISQSRYQDRDLEKEKLEKKRQLPFHMHINLDTLEAVHLLAAMFVEVPNIALYGPTNKRRVISKAFRRHYDHAQRQAFSGPPENTRDHVMAATKALRSGDWEKCYKHVEKLRMWTLMPHSTYVLSLAKRKICEESLRTYLLTYSTQFTSISMKSLISMFALDETSVYRIISKMMVNEQIHGAWDQPSNCIVIDAAEPTRLQKHALLFAEKAAVFTEQNERMMDSRGYGGDNRNMERRTGGEGSKPWVTFGGQGQQANAGGNQQDKAGGQRKERSGGQGSSRRGKGRGGGGGRGRGQRRA